MKKDLIRQLQEARKRLLNAIKKYPNHPKGEWSRKELLAHLAGWDEEDNIDVGAVPKILKGERPISFNKTVDNYNKESVAKRKNKTEQEIIDEMERSHTQFIKLLESLTEEQITNYYGTKLRGKDINVLWIINETIHHDNEHAREIEEKYGK